MSAPKTCPHCGAAASDGIRDFDHYTCGTHIATACRPYDPCRERELAEANSELAELRHWKASALAIEEEWDVQELAKMLDATLGSSCRKAISEGIHRLAAMTACAEKMAEALQSLYDAGQGGMQPANAKIMAMRATREALAEFEKLKGGEQ